MSIFKIALDAGHGPDTTGKRSPDGMLKEYQFNSVVTRYTAELLAGYQDVETLFTHNDTEDVPLAARTDKANDWGADIFVSIHANASGDTWSNMQGIETYVYISRPPAAVELANAVQRHMIRETGLVDRGVKSANFHVLRETRMTAILVECGFMTNREEVELLKSDAYRRTCAKAISAGIAETYGLTEKEEEQIPVQFKDVPAGHWAEKSILKVAKAGVMNGIAVEEFGPGQPLTREQMAVILDRLGLLEEK